MLKQRIYTLKRELKKIITGKKITDDFDWKLYNQHYQGELEDIAKQYTLLLKEDDYLFKNHQLHLKSNILPLHPNHRLLYESIMLCNPESAIEIGCGGGDHLMNIHTLNSNIVLYGWDVSEQQLQWLKKRHKNHPAKIEVHDITKDLPNNYPRVDVGYTQAVIMHIQTDNNYLTALRNLFFLASKQIILMENWKRHDFYEAIKKLHHEKKIPWDEIFFYYRISEEYKKPHIMIVSSYPISDSKTFIPLEDYSLLTKYVNEI